MSFALSQRHADRHPVGLLVVVGLHALLAAVLVSARLASRPGEPPPIALTPLDPVQPVVVQPKILPSPAKLQFHPLVVDTPRLPDDPPHDAPLAQPDDHPARHDEVVTAVGKPADDVVHAVARVLSRAARIDAGAAQCRPDYPAAAQRAGATGVTRIRFSVDASGRIAGSQILQASGASRENRLMDKAAAEALARCPVQVGTDETGRAVGTTTDVDYVWKLE